MLKMVLFGFMTSRQVADNRATPSYCTSGYFVNGVLAGSMEDIFKDIKRKIFEVEQVDLNHFYIDGAKFKTKTNKYSCICKKVIGKSRYRLFNNNYVPAKTMNESLSFCRIRLPTNIEYVIEELKEILYRYAKACEIDITSFTYEKDHRKKVQQR